MKLKKCQITDPECHLDVIQEWHGDLEANITTLILLYGRSSVDRRIAFITASTDGVFENGFFIRLFNCS